jgi:hypothetical protein
MFIVISDFVTEHALAWPLMAVHRACQACRACVGSGVCCHISPQPELCDVHCAALCSSLSPVCHQSVPRALFCGSELCCVLQVMVRTILLKGLMQRGGAQVS